MSTIHVAVENTVNAPAETVYGYLADFRNHHPKFLPPAFSGFEVEEGGVGAGTVVRYSLHAGGRNRPYQMVVDEPEPGRVLTESDTGSSLVTTFTVMSDGARPGGSRVRIESSWAGAGGVGGFFERRFAPAVLRRVLEEELVRLDTYARQQSVQGPPPSP